MTGRELPVIPAKAGIQFAAVKLPVIWIPAFAGMTVRNTRKSGLFRAKTAFCPTTTGASSY